MVYIAKDRTEKSVAAWRKHYVDAPPCQTIQEVHARLRLDDEQLLWMTLHTAKQLEKLFAANAIRTVLEIGHMHGVSTAYFAMLVTPRKGEVTTVDLPKSIKCRPNVEEVLAVCGLNAEILRADKGSNTVCPRLTRAGRQFDFAYIDGYHHSPQVDNDWKYAKQLVRPGGIVAFDDVISQFPEVVALWNDVVCKDPRVAEVIHITSNQQAVRLK